MRFFWRVKPTKHHGYSVSANARTPFLSLFKLRDAKQPAASVAFVRFTLVLHVLRYRYVAKIFNPIVAWVSVNVVNNAGRPISGNVKPSQTTSSVSFAVYPDNSSLVWFYAARNHARDYFATSFYAPSKQPGVAVIPQNILQLVKTDVGFAHAATLA
jgi:hypothetical protein